MEGLGVVVAGGGVAEAGGGEVSKLSELPGLLIAPGDVPTPDVLLSGGQFARVFGFTPEALAVWACSVAVPVPSTHGLISGTEPGVEDGPGVAVGWFPGTVP